VNVTTAREIALVAPRGYCWDFQDPLNLLERGATDLQEIAMHIFGSAQQQPFELLMHPGNEAVTVVIRVD
jgi:threonine dehydrogenase-like Zn-dependent dehydrogenase